MKAIDKTASANSSPRNTRASASSRKAANQDAPPAASQQVMGRPVAAAAEQIVVRLASAEQSRGSAGPSRADITMTPPRSPTKIRVAIACGGTGGHLFPGIAVAEELRSRGHDVLILISEKEVDAMAAADHPELRFAESPGDRHAPDPFAPDHSVRVEILAHPARNPKASALVRSRGRARHGRIYFVPPGCWPAAVSAPGHSFMSPMPSRARPTVSTRGSAMLSC